MHIFNLLLNAHEPKPFFIGKILGCYFLIFGGLTGAFFFFQVLLPFLGYIESGLIVSAVMVLIGLGLIFISRKKKASPPEEVAEKALRIFKELGIEKVLKNNALILSLLSLGVGVGLSQLKNIKKLTEIYKIFKSEGSKD